MKKIIVGSKNPVKVSGTLNAFEQAFPAKSFEVVGARAPSGVPDQPMSDEETLQGALNRAHYVKDIHKEAEFWVGIEGGICQQGEMLEVFAWIVVLSDNRMGRARTATFQLPPGMAAMIKSGMELGTADDMTFRRMNSKHGNGTVGMLTNDLIDREAYYAHAILLALVPFMKPHLYFANDGQN